MLNRKVHFYKHRPQDFKDYTEKDISGVKASPVTTKLR